MCMVITRNFTFPAEIRSHWSKIGEKEEGEVR